MITTSFRTSFLAHAFTALLTAVVGFPGAAHADEIPGEVVAQDFRIPSTAPGIELFVRNKHLKGKADFGPNRTVLYVHGATLASELVFDLPVNGLSWADDLARHGWDVWLVDVRGYGASSWPEALKQPAEANPPAATTDEAVADFGSAVDFIRDRRKVPSLQAIGWSWGSVIAGRFASTRPEAISGLVLLTPLWAFEKVVLAAPPAKAWQEWNLADAVVRVQKGVPAGQAEAILPAATVALWQKAVRDSQPQAAARTPEVFRTPTGVLADVSWRAEAPYDATAIKAPTLVVRAEWDELTPRPLALNLFSQLKGARVRSLLEIPRASHFVIAETGRDVLLPNVRAFLSAN